MKNPQANPHDYGKCCRFAGAINLVELMLLWSHAGYIK